DIQTARELAEQLYRMAESLQDPALLVEAHQALANVGWAAGDFDRGRVHAQQGIALYDPQQQQGLPSLMMDPGVMCLYYATPCLWCLGYPDQALRSSQEALKLAKELSHSNSVAAALTM